MALKTQLNRHAAGHGLGLNLAGLGAFQVALRTLFKDIYFSLRNPCQQESFYTAQWWENTFLNSVSTLIPRGGGRLAESLSCRCPSRARCLLPPAAPTALPFPLVRKVAMLSAEAQVKLVSGDWSLWDSLSAYLSRTFSGVKVSCPWSKSLQKGDLFRFVRHYFCTTFNNLVHYLFWM